VQQLPPDGQTFFDFALDVAEDDLERVRTLEQTYNSITLLSEPPMTLGAFLGGIGRVRRSMRDVRKQAVQR